ncbi:MAG: hypothetical protein AB7V50_00805 [Vampirovibrionia bacterium]
MNFNNDDLDQQANTNQEVQVDDPFAEINSLVEPLDLERPESVCFHFFFYLIKGQCDEAWSLFSKYSKQKIIDNIYDDIKETDEFYMQDQITNKVDLKKAFETNHPSLRKTFWLSFAEDIKLPYLVEYAEFRTKTIKGNKAYIDAVFKLKDGKESKAPFLMVYEDSLWKFALMESVDEN